MRLCTTRPQISRTWTVELRPHPQGPLLVCAHCSTAPKAFPGSRARSAALEHLAHHARRSPLPLHLRTCQCHERGCRWHPRHRGCDGPLLLVLACERGGRLWRLTDACTACARDMTNASVVPETRLISTCPAQIPRAPRHRVRLPAASAELAGQMLSYLAVSLPQETSSGARLFALQAILRASTAGTVRLRPGLVRGMGLLHPATLWAELISARWITPSADRSAPYTGWLTDPVPGLPGHKRRTGAADWALRTASRGRASGLGATGQLLTVTLHALVQGSAKAGSADSGQLSRLCGLPATALPAELDQLVKAGALKHWSLTASSEEADWQLP